MGGSGGHRGAGVGLDAVVFAKRIIKVQLLSIHRDLYTAMVVGGHWGRGNGKIWRSGCIVAKQLVYTHIEFLFSSKNTIKSK